MYLILKRIKFLLDSLMSCCECEVTLRVWIRGETVEFSAGSHMAAMLSPAGPGTLCTEREEDAGT